MGKQEQARARNVLESGTLTQGQSVQRELAHLLWKTRLNEWEEEREPGGAGTLGMLFWAITFLDPQMLPVADASQYTGYGL